MKIRPAYGFGVRRTGDLIGYALVVFFTNLSGHARTAAWVVE